jgi:hypothetical protein
VPVAIVAALLAAEVGARVVGPNIERTAGSEERAFIKADQIARRGQTDVVIFGSSETAGGLIPSVIEAEVPALDGAYNAALAGARLDLTRDWADRIALPGLQPEVVVIGMQPTAVVAFDETDFDPAADTAPAYRAAFDQIDPGGLGSLGYQLRQRSDLIRYRPYLRSPTALWSGVRGTLAGGDDEPADDGRMDWETETDPDRVLRLTAADGEVLEYRSPGTTDGDNAMAVAAFTAAGSLPYDFEQLEAVFAVVRDHGAIPVVALAPVDREVLDAAGADLSGLDRAVAELEAWVAERDVPLLDRFTERWPAAWFHDRQHVAEAGAERWSRDVGAWLAELCAAGRLGDACAP